MKISNPIAGEVGHITILGASWDSIGQGTWGVGHGASIYIGYVNNGSKADGDNLSYKVWLPSGTYTLLLLCRHHPDGGIYKVDIDGATVLTYDSYYVALENNQRVVQTGIAVTENKIRDIKLKVDGKHASSSDYSMYVHALIFWRTA